VTAPALGRTGLPSERRTGERDDRHDLQDPVRR
jgi:hypothetical protein